MKAVCSGHWCLRIAGNVQQQLWLEQVSWMAPVLPCPVVSVWLWSWPRFCPAPSALWAVGVPVFQIQSWLIAPLPSLWSLQFWHCSFPAPRSFHGSVLSGTALALPILGVVEQIVLLPLGELRYHPCLGIFTGTLLHPLLPELLYPGHGHVLLVWTIPVCSAGQVPWAGL